MATGYEHAVWALNEAARLAAHAFPYVYGGGHGVAPGGADFPQGLADFWQPGSTGSGVVGAGRETLGNNSLDPAGSRELGAGWRWLGLVSDSLD